MGSDDAKKLILARRARFVAAAVASMATATPVVVAVEGCGSEETAPQPCLSVDASLDSGVDRTDADAQVPPLGDAGDEGGPNDGGLADAKAGDDDAGPQPCLAPPPMDR